MTTASTAAARRISCQLETLWDSGSVPTHRELASLYETAKRRCSVIPRLQRLGLMSERVESRYREIGLLD